MSEWVRRWQVDVCWRPGLPGDRLAARRVGTVADLRKLVIWARRHPDVAAVRHRPVRELVATRRTPAGAAPVRRRIRDPGRPRLAGVRLRRHIIHTCGWPDCGDVRPDPPVSTDCI